MPVGNSYFLLIENCLSRCQYAVLNSSIIYFSIAVY